MMRTESGTFYAVLIRNPRAPEKAFLSHSMIPSFPQLYKARKDAVAYKRACANAGLKHARVVKVAVTLKYDGGEQ